MNASRVQLSGFRQMFELAPSRRGTAHQAGGDENVSAELMWGSFPDCYFLPALLLSRETSAFPAGVAVTPPPVMSRALAALS